MSPTTMSNFMYLLLFLWLIKRQSCHHVETSQLICTANLLTGFCMMTILAFKGYLRFKTITPQNVSCDAQIKDFFIWLYQTTADSSCHHFIILKNILLTWTTMPCLFIHTPCCYQSNFYLTKANPTKCENKIQFKI